MSSTKDNREKVLYQKLGDTWYVFSKTKDNQVIYTALPKGIDPHSTKLDLYELIEENEAPIVNRRTKDIAA